MKHLSYLLAAIALSSCEDKSSSPGEPESKIRISERNISRTSETLLSLKKEQAESEKPEQRLRVADRPPQQPEPKRPKYPFAEAISDKAGFVFNPVTGGEVDVRGIPPGTLVLDPKDPDQNKFRTPEATE